MNCRTRTLLGRRPQPGDEGGAAPSSVNGEGTVEGSGTMLGGEGLLLNRVFHLEQGTFKEGRMWVQRRERTNFSTFGAGTLADAARAYCQR